jgi:hypothetical protein
MLPHPLYPPEVMRVNMLLSTRLEDVIPKLNAPAAMLPTPEIAAPSPAPQARPKTLCEEADEMAEALRQDLAASFVSSPIPFTFSPQPSPEPAETIAASPHLTAAGIPAPLEGGNYICRHCGNAFRSIFAVNGHKAHSKECSVNGRELVGK